MLQAMLQEAQLLAATYAPTPHGVGATKEHTSQQPPMDPISTSPKAATATFTPAPASAPGVLLIGSDIPSISVQVLQAAATALASHDMVLGPAADGGYYLIGLSAAALWRSPLVRGGDIFQGVTWSTSQVLQQQVAAAEACGLTLAPLDTLPTLQDIDVMQDAVTWLQQQWLSTGPPLGLGQEQTTDLPQLHTGGHQASGANNKQHHVPDTICHADPRPARAQPPEQPGEVPVVHLTAQDEERPDPHKLERGHLAACMAGHSLQRVQEAAQRMLQAAGVHVPA
jgi:hypothetical protein